MEKELIVDAREYAKSTHKVEVLPLYNESTVVQNYTADYGLDTSGNPQRTVLPTLINTVPKTKKKLGDRPEISLLNRPRLVEAYTPSSTSSTDVPVGFISENDVDYIAVKTSTNQFRIYSYNNITGATGTYTAASGGPYYDAPLDFVYSDDGLGKYIIATLLGTTTLYYSNTVGALSTSTLPKTAYTRLIGLNNTYYFGAVLDGLPALYNTTPGSLVSFPTTNYLVAEIVYGHPAALTTHHNHLVFFTNTGVELFYDGAVELGSPLVRREEYASFIGLAGVNQKLVCEVGDVIYYIGRSSEGIVGLYKLENFKISEIQSDLFSSFLNDKDLNWDGSYYVSLFGSNRTTTSLSVSNIYGEPTLILSVRKSPSYETVANYTGTEKFPVLCYGTQSGSWWVLQHPDTPSDSTLPVYDFKLNSASKFYSVDNRNASGTHRVFTFEGTSNNKYPPGKTYVESVPTATIYTPWYNFGQNNRKHIKSLEFIGNFSVNTTLTVSASDNYHLSYKAANIPVSINQNDGIYTVRNLGNYKYIALKIQINNSASFELRECQIEYNLGMS